MTSNDDAEVMAILKQSPTFALFLAKALDGEFDGGRRSAGGRGHQAERGKRSAGGRGHQAKRGKYQQEAEATRLKQEKDQQEKDLRNNMYLMKWYSSLRVQSS
jgi:hypothetical protein